jgi:hypothetical protein
MPPFLCNGFTITPIRNIITSHAFSSSVLKNINEEFITDTTVINDLLQYHSHIPLDILYTTLFVISIWYQFSTIDNRKNWEDIELYKDYRRKFNMILLFIFILFFRNIDNAI